MVLNTWAEEIKPNEKKLKVNKLPKIYIKMKRNNNY